MAKEDENKIIQIAENDLKKMIKEERDKAEKENKDLISALEKKLDDINKNNAEEIRVGIQKAVAERKSIEDHGLDLNGEVVPFKESLETLLSKNQAGHIDGRAPTDWERDLMKSCDDLTWTRFAYCEGNNGRNYSDLFETKAFKKYERIIKYGASEGLSKALDSTAGKGLEFIPTILSSRLTEKIEVALRVMNLFQRFQMPGANTDIPRVVGFPTAFKGQILTTPTDSQVTTGKASYVAEKIIAMTLLAYETNMDSIIPLIPLSEDHLSLAIARATDEAAVNGQESGDIDLPALAATDARKLWDGLRKNAIANGFTTDIGAALTLTNVRAFYAAVDFAFGSEFQDMVYIVGQNEYNQLRGLPEVTTIDKFGSPATIIDGILRKIDGVDVVTSQFPPQNMDANGVILDPPSGDKVGLLLTSKRFWGFGVWQNIFLESDRDIGKQEIKIVGSMRADFKGLQPETLEGYQYGINITKT